MGGASSTRDRLAAKSGWLVAAIVAGAAAILLAMGRSPICPCGHLALWHGPVRSPENSQQLLDWYSLSHLVHGLLLYAAGALVLRRWPWRARLVIATLIEAGWEVLENSPAIIDRYRAVTISWGYAGDSVLNSVGDIGCMVLGFVVASRLRGWQGVALGLALELVALAAIRDNLTLNLLMLLAPSPAILAWQAAG